MLERLELNGDETVLDAGCGSGRMTRHLVARVPRGRVIGVDAAPSMVALARERLGDAAELYEQDLLELDLGRLRGERGDLAEVDAVFSSATFHWVPDHERLFARLHSALRPGGRLEAQCGGRGNVAELDAALRALAGDPCFSDHLGDSASPWNFAEPEETEARLRRAGFGSVRVWLEEVIARPAEPRGFVAASGLSVHLERLPEPLRDSFVDALMDSLPKPLELRYVRLNISARRPG